jgi:hypothetical protein
LKIIKGWKKLSNEGGYVNETTGQTLTISKKEFSSSYHALLFAGEQTNDAQGKKISPDFSKKTQAETSALNWMEKHPNGISESEK